MSERPQVPKATADREAALVRRLLASEGMRAMHIRNYRLFFAGQSISLVGGWIQEIAIIWLVLRLTDDPIWLGVVAVAKYVPVVALSMVAGVAADTLSKRRMLIGTQVAIAVVSALFAILVLAGIAQLWMILLFTFALGVASAVEWPVRQAFVIEVVGLEHAGAAIALNSAMFNGARLLGPAVAGLAIGLAGEGFALALGATTFLAAVFGLRAMSEAELHLGTPMDRPESAGAVGRSLREGLSYIRSSSMVLASVLIVCSVAMVGMNLSVLMPPFVSRDLGGGATTFGFLMAAAGAGSMLATARLIFGGRPKPIRLATGALMLGIASIALAMTRSVPVALGLMVAIGFGSILMTATGNTTVQLGVPDHLRGRVVSVYLAVYAASVPIGGLAMGAVASMVGPAAAIGLGGALTVLLALATWMWGRRDAFSSWAPELIDREGARRPVVPRGSGELRPTDPQPCARRSQ